MVPSLIRPSYQQDFYSPQRGGIPLNPNLWNGVVGAWSPSLGVTGNRLLDQSGFSNSGSLAGGVTWVISKDGYALDFDAVDSRVTITDNAVFPRGNSPRTISFRFNADTFAGGIDEIILAYASGGANGEVFEIAAEDNAISIAFQGHRVITPKSALSTGVDYSVAVVVPGGAVNTSDVLIYINGINQSLSDEAGGSQTLNTGADDITIGARVGPQRFYNGRLGNIHIQDIGLTSNEIMQFHIDPEALFRTRRIIGRVPIGGATHEEAAVDSIVLGDTSTSVVILPSGVGDGILLGDSDINSVVYLSAITDGVVFNDSIATALVGVVSVSDSVVFNDLPNGGFLFSVSLADGIDLGDTIVATLTRVGVAVDSVEFNDSISTIATLVAAILDSIDFGDSAALSGNIFNISVADGITLGDLVIQTGALITGMTVTFTLKQATIAFTLKQPTATFTLKQPTATFTKET